MLQNENRTLHAENEQLLANQMSAGFSAQHAAQDQAIQTIDNRLLVMHKDLTARMDGMAQMLSGCIRSESMTTRGSVSMSQRQLGGDIATLSSDLQRTSKKIDESINASTDSIQQKITTERNLLAAVIEETRSAVSTHDKDIKELLIQYFHQMMEHQNQLAAEVSSSTNDSNREFIHIFEEYCKSTLGSIANTGDIYYQMQNDERECLEKIRLLSNEMLGLGEHQKKIMEELSQLCRDSDQFLEIQKSINDIWEIMKAVWVDSLLSDYQRILG